jgi:hypothetical protein
MDPDDPKFEKRRGERPSMRMDDPKWIERMRTGGDVDKR